MQSLVFFGIAAVLWILAAPLIALVSAARARRQTSELQARLTSLEARLAVLTGTEAPDWGAAPTPETPPAETPEPSASEAPIPWPPQPRQPAPAMAEQPSEAEPPPPPPEPPLPPQPKATRPGRQSLETLIGAQWTVLVGGLALALGAVFLVRYTIEQGLLGPGMRITLGALLSAVLFAAGETLRRRDRRLELPILPRADVPAILTAAGGVAAFATVYAAHALYGFVGPGAAFVLLTVVGLVTLLLSVIHGPALAALGALGSYAAPLLVSSTEPNALALVLHILAVTAAVLGMARIRDWLWLALSGLVASFAWGLLLGAEGHGVIGEQALLLAGLTLIYVATLVAQAIPARLRDRPIDPPGIIALALLAALCVEYWGADHTFPGLAAGIVLVGVCGAAASRWTQVAPAALIAGALAVATTALIPPPALYNVALMRLGTLEWLAYSETGLPAFAMQAAAIGALVGIGSAWSADRAAATAPRTAGYFAAAGAAAPLLILAIVYLRHAPFETRPLIGLAALALAGIFAALTERMIVHRPSDDMAPAPALYAAGAVLALSFAMAVGLAFRFVPLALSLGAAGIAWVSLARPVKLLPWLAVACAALACVALAAGPGPYAEAIGTRPIFNGLILRLGLPAAAVLLGSEILRRRKGGLPVSLLQTIGLVLLARFVMLEIHHYSTGGHIAYGWHGLGEQSALTISALAFAVGLQLVARHTKSVVYNFASLAAGLVGAVMIAAEHFVLQNPLVTGESVGSGAVFNLLLPGYLLPALMAAWVAAAARKVRPRTYVVLVAALALALALAYLTLMVRHAFHGPYLDVGRLSDPENWSYSAAWLVFGILLLSAGLAVHSTMVRAASGVVIAVVVCKVFLFDMSALTGVLRAVSFLGLGATLIVIGRLYQKLLMSGLGGGSGAAAASDAGPEEP